MRLNLVLELLDVPGKLLEALEPIGKLGANIVTVIHQRDVKTERGTIPVNITIEGDKKTLKMVLKSMEELGIQIIEVDGIMQKEEITTVIIGNIIDENLGETIKALEEIEGVRVADLDLKMSDHPGRSASKIIVEADYGKRGDVQRKIKEIGNSKGFLIINEV